MIQELRNELEQIRADQNNSNPMDISLNMDAAELNHVKQQAEEEKHLAKERLAKAKADHEQVLRDKNHKITMEIEHLKKQMEDQICRKREASLKASKHQLQTIMLELHSLKEKQEKDTTGRKVGEKALLDNIKASIDPILKSDQKGAYVLKGCKRKLQTIVLLL